MSADGAPVRLVVIRHALRNAMIPVTTLLALQVGVLFGGTVVLESIFSFPGCIQRFSLNIKLDSAWNCIVVEHPLLVKVQGN